VYHWISFYITYSFAHSSKESFSETFELEKQGEIEDGN